MVSDIVHEARFDRRASLPRNTQLDYTHDFKKLKISPSLPFFFPPSVFFRFEIIYYVGMYEHHINVLYVLRSGGQP